MAASAGRVAAGPQKRLPARINGLNDPLGKLDGAHYVYHYHPRTKDDIGENGAATRDESLATLAGYVVVDGLHQQLQVTRPNLASN